jgi:hypothetical protein
VQLSVGLALKPTRVDRVRRDVLRTAKVASTVWLNGTQRNTSSVPNSAIWTYVGTASGVFRTYPGHRSSPSYNWWVFSYH